jgi:hypothetical protein
MANHLESRRTEKHMYFFHFNQIPKLSAHISKILHNRI